MIHDEVLLTNRDTEIDVDDARDTGEVTFEYDPNVLCVTSSFERAGEHGVITSSTLSNTELPVGTYSVTPVYTGDVNFSGFTSGSEGSTVTAAATGG